MNEKIIVIECMELTEERKRIGYLQFPPSDHIDIISFKKEKARCINLINNADIVDYGWHLVDLLKTRVKNNSLTFLENERLLKKGLAKFLDLRLWKQIKFNLNVRNKNVFFLSTGDYAARDYRLLGFNKNKILRFGYFTKTYFYENVFENKTEEGPLRCIWVGRFINWKKPLDVLEVIKKIDKDKIQLRMLGDGVLRRKIERYILEYSLDNVELTGILPLCKVRDEMLKADVLISTSNKAEGWGTVINEAMNSGCAVISSDCTGAVPNLIEGGLNGFVYKSGNIKQLEEKLIGLTNNKQLARKLGQNAYLTITRLWNEKIAAERLLQWINEYKRGNEKIFNDGPCSKVFSDKLKNFG